MLQLTINVLGGLAIFVYGMNLMSDGLKEIAGARLKAVLGYIARNRITAILAGALVTAVIQSSSATTVMTVGFVNAGLISLVQAIGVIFGANIGTTITGQLVSLNLDDLALPSIILGVVGLLVSKRKKSRGAWRTVLGFGLLFFGMSLMSHELKVLAKAERFISFFSLFDCTPVAGATPPFLSVLGAVAVGAICTMIVQSSSATIGITIALAEAGIISIWTAVPIILGDNIGTTITAALAAIGANANAKRTALAHALFNVIGTVLVIASFPIVLHGASGVDAPAFLVLMDASTAGNAFAGENPGRHVAMAHTLFNVTNVIVLTFFIPALARLCERIIPDGKRKGVHLLEPRLIATPELAVQAGVQALADMTRRATTIANVALNAGLGRASIAEEAIWNAEREIDSTQQAIQDYLVKIMHEGIGNGEAAALPEIVHCVNDAERIADLAVILFRKTTERKPLSPEDIALVQPIGREVHQLAHLTQEALRGNRERAQEAIERERRLSGLISEALDKASGRLRQAGDGAQADLVPMAMISCLRDISRHLGNIATRAPAFC